MLLLTSYSSFSQEICNNGKDDDGDGLIDLQDPDCQCHFNVSGNILKNGSFELHKNCPTNYSYDQDHAIVDFWQYGNYTSGNLAEYYHNFNCPYDSAQVMLFMPPQLPLPDGKAFMAIRQYVYRNPFLKETDIAKVYISQCLQTPLMQGEQYTLSFNAGRFKSNDDRDFKFKSEPFTVAIFGNTDCNAAPFGPPLALSNGCPANFSGWKLLGKTTVNSKGKWVQNKINFTVPTNINVIEIGPDCSLLEPINDLTDSTTFLDYYVYYLDDLHLLPTADFPFRYIKTQGGNPCVFDSVLKAPVIQNGSYQWYKDSIAIIGAVGTSYTILNTHSIANYNVRITTSDSCFISEPFLFTPGELDKLKIPADTSLCKNDTLLLAAHLPGLTYSLNGQAVQDIKIFQAGIYQVAVLNTNGCERRFTVTVHPENCQIFMPNVFTPNGDGKNDLFRIPAGIKINLKEFSIFDRFGNRIYTSTNSKAAWDGKFNGALCPADVYVYFIQGFSNNKNVRIRGSVTLLR